MTKTAGKNQKEQSMIIIILGVCFASLFLIAGIVTLLVAPKAGPKQIGTLIQATGSKGMMSNNTTLIVRTIGGQELNFEVKSSLQASNIKRIRRTARSNIGKTVTFRTTDWFGRSLIEMETTDGTAIVSASHTNAARLFTGWGMLISSLVIIIYGVFAGNRLHQMQKGASAASIE